MKTPLPTRSPGELLLQFGVCLTALCCLPLATRLQAASDPSLLPDGRQKVDLRAAERNPFTQQVTVETPTAAPQEGATEESRLRRILRAVKIGGLSGQPGKQQALLGSLILKPGAILPPILENQYETLKVTSVSDKEIVLSFVERDSSVDSRKIVLPFAIKPEVTQLMYGEAFENLTKVGAGGKMDLPLLQAQGVNDLLQGSRDADLKNMADRDVEMMGVVTHAENSKESK